MPRCPHCGQESGRRKAGACPKCGGMVHLVRDKNVTHWVAEKTSAMALVDKLEEYIIRRPGLRHFTFGPAGSKPRMAQAGAATTLLRRCEWDQGLAEEVISTYCDGSQKLYPPRNMFGVIGKQFDMALAIAKHTIEEEDKERESQRRMANSSMNPLEVYLGI